MSGRDARAGAMAEIRAGLAGLDVKWREPEPGLFQAELPGTRKLATSLTLTVGSYAVGVHAFVCRQPDENHQQVYRWLLERNLRLYQVAFGLDAAGDIYLNGRLPFAAVTAAELDQLLGAVLDAADSSFNALLELGFASSIRREYAWRLARGESVRNLEAFRGWLDRPD